jgi:L-asparaginase/Glu-tRNA(Gln) amidotransferase subunit D
MSAKSRRSGSKGPIGLVITGGTIGAEVSSGVADVSARAELALVEAAADYVSDVRVTRAMRKLSENMQPEDWVTIARAVRQLVIGDKLTGVVVLHGTDTMAFTSAALSFLLADLEQPVVLTGANTPLLEPGSDAMTNLKDAVYALSGLASRHMGGTYICFSGIPGKPSQLLAGVNVRKSIAVGQAYESVNRHAVARISQGSFRLKSNVAPRQALTNARMQVDSSVKFLRLMPGTNFAVEADNIIAGGYRGVVVELYPGWTGPISSEQYSLSALIDQVTRAGVVVATTVSHSSRHRFEYVSEAALRSSGALVLEETLPETAYVKLMWALGQYSEASRVRELMLTNIAGELGQDSTQPDQTTDVGTA